MKVVFGLGNPGPEYASTRHNVGWWVADQVRERGGFGPFRRQGSFEFSAGRLDGLEILVVKPLTYMNRSGKALLSLMQVQAFDPAVDLLVVVDDVALPVGRTRLRPGGSSGGHKGLLSIEFVLGSRDYARLRIGVGGPEPGSDLSAWVLSPFADADEGAVRELLPEIAEAVQIWAEKGVQAASTHLSR